MIRQFTCLFAILGLFTGPLSAADLASAESLEEQMIRPAEGVDLNEFLWIKRPIVVFADTPADPRFTQQMDLLNAGLDELDDRDVVILVDTDPAARTAVRTKLRPRGFSLVLLGKDGQVKWRKPSPREVWELNRAIDSFPLRRDEIREKRAVRTD